jgi:hypothetical protein
MKKWLIYRLRTMGPAEIFSRLLDVGRNGILYASLPRMQRHAWKQTESTDWSLPVSNLNSLIESTVQEEQDRVVAEATQWLKHRGSFFDLHDIDLGNPINWQCDYSSGVIGPMRYSGFIDYRDAAVVGDAKYIWELNRLQCLILLALAAVWTGRKAYGDEIHSQILSWYAQNPFMRGLNWKSPLEAGLRLISLAFALLLTKGSKQAEGDLYTALCETLYQHQYFIRKFYSKHSSANNHLIGEMAGLYIGSVCWPWYRQSEVWRSFAKRKLLREIARQVEPDGVSKERATEYQLFVLEFFLLAGALGQAIDDPFLPEYWERLRDMVAFLAAISDREGHLPMFGDGDSSQVIWLPETLQERTRTLIRLGQPLPGSTAGAASTDLRASLLLWGQTPTEIPLASVPEPVQGLQAFPQGGYYVLAVDRGSDDEMVAVFDAGSLGLPPLYAHGHADALSFWLSYGGREFLIDPGTFCYYTHERWRTYFRGTAAHNTIRIDGQDQSIAGGRFLWRHVAHCQAEHMQDTDQFAEVEGFHDGYRRLPDPVIHRRGIRLLKRVRTLVITDRLECQREHDIEIFFHFSEQCQVQQVGLTSFEAAHDKKRLAVHLDPRLQPELYRGTENPIFGWVSRTFGVKEPAFTLVTRGKVTGSTQFLTEITATNLTQDA